MGELIPFLAVAIIIMVGVIALYWKKIINAKLSSHSMDNDQIIFRQVIDISSTQADELIHKICAVQRKAADDNEFQNVDFNVTDKMILRFVIKSSKTSEIKT